MARVVVVHGINNTYSAPDVMAAEWVPALRGGVSLAGGALTAEDIRCVFYGDVFRPPGRRLGEDDLELLNGDDIQDPREVEVLEAWWRAASEVDSAVFPPDATGLGALDRVRAALAALSCSRFLAGTTERLFVLILKQVRDYFTRPDLRALIQQRFFDAMSSETAVVVAHSLGSVVAYEALIAYTANRVCGLVTLGSPLGIRNLILDRLIPAPQRDDAGRLRAAWPPAVRNWTNISGRLDFVPLVKELRPVFGDQLVDLEIDNGTRVHDVRRYLSARETGTAILSCLGNP
jgi:hypothetical protein